MTSKVWGLTQPLTEPEPPGRRSKPNNRPRLSPEAARAGHRGIVWLHLLATGVWLLVAVALEAIAAAGKAVPAVVIVTSVGAAASHGVFSLVHLFLASAARSSAAASSVAELGLRGHHEKWPTSLTLRPAGSAATGVRRYASSPTTSRSQ